MITPVTDTPRTTALMYPNGAMSIEILEHTRTLERELIAMTEKYDSMTAAYRAAFEDILKIEKERNEARLAFKILGDKYDQLIKEIKAKSK